MCERQCEINMLAVSSHFLFLLQKLRANKLIYQEIKQLKFISKPTIPAKQKACFSQDKLFTQEENLLQKVEMFPTFSLQTF